VVDVGLRSVRDEDVPAICALINRVNVHDAIPQVFTEEELIEELERVDAAADARVVDADDGLAGYVLSFFLPSGGRLERAFIFGYVDPVRRGRGIGRALLDWATARATEQLRSCPNSLPKFVRAEVYEQVADAHRLFVEAGFTAVRWFEELLRPLDEVPPLDVHPDYEVITWPQDRPAELLDVRNEAFADHWGSVPWTMERFEEAIARQSTRLDLSVATVERASGVVVGLCFNEHYPQDTELLGRTDGWIAVLGTRAAHRGRGLASSMINASLARFAAEGFTHASIGVDSASPTGANRLYRTLGFQPQQQHTTYELRVE
jgi:mycothiol synthase